MGLTTKQIDDAILNDPGMQRLADEDPTGFDAEVANIYREHGYDEYGAPLSVVQKGSDAISDTLGVSKDTLKAGAAFGIEAATTVGGAVVGGLVGGPSGAVVGGMAGSLGGAELNAAIGLTDPLDNYDRAIAAGAPLLGPVVGRAMKYGARGAVKTIPGAGFELHHQAGKVFEHGLDSLRVSPKQLSEAWTAVRAVPDFKIRVPAILDTLQNHLSTVSRQAKFATPGAKAETDEVLDMLKEFTQRKHVSFKDLDALSKKFNDLKSENPLYKRLAGAVLDDLETASKNPLLTEKTRQKAAQGLQAFRNAFQVTAQHNATESLDNLMYSVLKPAAGNPHVNVFDKAAFIRGLRRKDIVDVFPKDQLDAMAKAVEDVGFIGKIAPIDDSALGIIGRSGPAAAVGYAAGGQSGAIIGYAIHKKLTDYMRTETGRKVIRFLAKQGRGQINMLELQSIMGKVVAGASAGALGAYEANQATETQRGLNAFTNQQ